MTDPVARLNAALEGRYTIDRWDVAPGDQGFVFVRTRLRGEGASTLILVKNWFEELRQRVGN